MKEETKQNIANEFLTKSDGKGIGGKYSLEKLILEDPDENLTAQLDELLKKEL